MSVWRLSVIYLGSAFFGLAQQTEDSRAEEEIRSVIDQYMNSVRQGDRAKVSALVDSNAKRSSPGGIAQIGLLERALPSWKLRANLIRRVEVLGPSTAIAIGVWRDFDAAPPFDTGTVHYTLMRKQGAWRIAHSYESFLPAPQKVSSLTGAQQETGAPVAGRRGPDDWEPLFDGRTLNGWVATDFGTETRPSWRIDDGCLVAIEDGPRSSLITRQAYLFFDLRFEWLAAPKTNSGVKYRLFGFDRIQNRSREAMGFEYQIADDEGDPGARIDPKQRSGALYAVTPVERSQSLSGSGMTPGSWSPQTT